MQVMVYDPYVQANVIEAAGDYRSLPEFEAALPETDVLTVHMPLGADSRGLIGAAELARAAGACLRDQRRARRHHRRGGARTRR